MVKKLIVDVEESIIKAIDELEILLCNYLKTSEIEEYLMLLAGVIQNEAQKKVLGMDNMVKKIRER